MAVVQLFIGLLRPGLSHSRRGAWAFLHYGWGRLAMLLGVTTLFLGVVLIHESQVGHGIEDLVGCKHAIALVVRVGVEGFRYLGLVYLAGFIISSLPHMNDYAMFAERWERACGITLRNGLRRGLTLDQHFWGSVRDLG
jgi:hypothetical protein